MTYTRGSNKNEDIDNLFVIFSKDYVVGGYLAWVQDSVLWFSR